MERKHNFQTISWFNDLKKRDLLDLDPPYQRRSVWNQEYKDYFIDTILLKYPAPAIFLFEEINELGTCTYNVVDGKQRLLTIFEFVDNKFPVSETASKTELRNKYFEELDKDSRIEFWSYSFLVEYLPTSDENIINNIFDRINRNVAKLTSQELRHAKFSGHFITTSEDLTDFIIDELGNIFPRIAQQSRKQMKDVEFVAQLLLLIEEGPKGYNIDELDQAFSDRDTIWENKNEVTKKFKQIIRIIREIQVNSVNNEFSRSRYANQADFHTLFGVILNDIIQNNIKNQDVYLVKLMTFSQLLDSEEKRIENNDFEKYYQHIKSASNRTKARKERIDILHKFIND